MHFVSNGPEDKPLMLLVHGFPEFWYSWRHQLREFKDDYRYMFFFQMPLVPEFVFATSDYSALDDLFRGKESGVRSDSMTADDVEAYKYAFSRSGFTGPINFYRAAFSLESMMGAAKMTEESKRRGITMPTLVIWGEEDVALEKPLAELSCEICKGKYTIKYVEGSSHWVQMDQPGLVNRYMREFLAE
nr:hypothetical protein BaRGS_020153 [Batillaria attramentaria]